MNIIELSTGKKIPVEIKPVENSDYKLLTKKRFFFDWKIEKNYEVYKLVVKGKNDTLGLISIERIPDEWRIHIRLLTVSIENMGKNKKFDKIVRNLISYVSKLAVKDFGELACISLRPKSSITNHYIKKYQMKITGMTLSLEVPEILYIINQYKNDK